MLLISCRFFSSDTYTDLTFSKISHSTEKYPPFPTTVAFMFLCIFFTSIQFEFHFEFLTDNVRAVEILLKNGANPNAHDKNAHNESAIHASFIMSMLSIVFG